MILRQFISRRGPPKEIWSDRGTNFIGANRELRSPMHSGMKKGLNDSCSRRASSGSYSHLLLHKCLECGNAKWKLQSTWKGIVGDGLLYDLELRTLLAEVESIVNNRPVTAVSDDPADFTALTPNHFLLQRATQLPPGVFVSKDKFSLRRWRKVQFLVDHYWKR